MAAVGQSKFFFLYSEFLDRPWPFPAYVVGGSALGYLVFVYGFCAATRPTSPAAVQRAQTLRYWHNIALMLFSLVSFVATFYHLFESGELFSLNAMVCNPVPMWLWNLNLAFTLSKIWEWADTMFLVWFKGTKDLQFLHVYHHTTTFWLYLHMTTLPGMLKMGILLNGLVHTLMYAHYAWPFPKKLVPFITLSQIAQLLFVTYVWSITPGTCGGRLGEFPSEHPFDFVTPYCFVPVYIIFFVKFFVERFLLGKKKGTKKE